MIKKRNLDPSLVQWIMTQTGLGPGVGEVFYVAPAASATSQYKTQLESMGVNVVHALPSTAETYMTAYRNDVMLVAPGAYAETAEIAWDKANSHIIGLAGPHQGSDYSEFGVSIYSVTTDVAEVVDCTGHHSQFHNVNFTNAGNNAACLAAFNLDTYNCVFKGCAFHGVMTAGQDDVVAAAALYIDQAGFYPYFEDCQIGQNEWDAREGANSGVLRYVSGGSAGAPSNGVFRRCRFLSRSDTATVAMVAVPSVDFIGRAWLFDNCFFHNLSTTQTNLNQAFYVNTSSSDNIPSVNLHHCMASGIDEWQNGDVDAVVADMPIVGIGGGLGRAPTGTTGN